MAKFNVYNTSIENIVGWIRSGEVAVPEIQRPFVWENSKVRDLLDSLYKGFPVGYLIVWKNPDIRLKDGTISKGKKILIDGQQRVTALQASVAGNSVIDKTYSKKSIKIAFRPDKKEFEVLNSAIEKDSKWVPDISKVFDPNFSQFSFVSNYCKVNEIDQEKWDEIANNIQELRGIGNTNLGVIELSDNLSIEEVTEIFIRINSKGVSLSQADFAMSKISSDNTYGGNTIRKMIDYFCHFMQNPSDYETIVKNDEDFLNSDDHRRIKWILKENNEIYVPDYTDVLRVSFTHKFQRGKIADLVSLLSGRNFETRENQEEIAKEAFEKLRAGVEAFVNETNFKRYLMIVKSAGIIDRSLIRSQSVLNFGYILYLTLKDNGLPSGEIEKLVRKWLIISILTSRYSGSTETVFDSDIKKLSGKDPKSFIESIEKGELSDAFWNNVLVSQLDTSVSNSPYFKLFLMAQIKNGDRGFLSESIDVKSLVEDRGDIHHIFPKKYLQKNGITNKGRYNQIANYAYTQSEINIKIKDDSPKEYMGKMNLQIKGEGEFYGGIKTDDDLKRNLRENAIPEDLAEIDITGYDEFLEKRRRLMAKKIRQFYESL